MMNKKILKHKKKKLKHKKILLTDIVKERLNKGKNVKIMLKQMKNFVINIKLDVKKKYQNLYFVL